MPKTRAERIERLLSGLEQSGAPPQTISRLRNELQGAGVLDGDQPDLLGGVSGEAHARSTDPGTSHAAAKSLSEDDLRESQEEVLDLFEKHGAMTDEQMVDRAERHGIRQSRSGLRTRRKELVDGGLIADTGLTRELRSGRDGVVWDLTTKGWKVVEGGGDDG